MRWKTSYTYSLWPNGDLKPRAVDITSKFCRNLALLPTVLESGDTDEISRIFLKKIDVKDLFRRPTYEKDDEWTDEIQSQIVAVDGTGGSKDNAVNLIVRFADDDEDVSTSPDSVSIEADHVDDEEGSDRDVSSHISDTTEITVPSQNEDKCVEVGSTPTHDEYTRMDTPFPSPNIISTASDDEMYTPVASPNVIATTCTADQDTPISSPSYAIDATKGDDRYASVALPIIIVTPSADDIDAPVELPNISVTPSGDDIDAPVELPTIIVTPSSDDIDAPVELPNIIITPRADDTDKPVELPNIIVTPSSDDIDAPVPSPNIIATTIAEEVDTGTVDHIKFLPTIKHMDNSEIDILRTAYGALYKLGTGYYGVVYMAKCKRSGDMLVCKELCAELSTMEEMENEAKLLSLLGPTGSVPELLGVIKNVRQTGNCGLIQRYIPDMETLDNLLDDPYYTDKVRLVNVALNLATALGNIHSLGVIHNDLKQDNILVRRSTSCVRIIDFGLATYKNGFTFETGSGDESRFPHIAPEAFHGKSTFESDIFSLGYLMQQINRKVGAPALDRMAHLCSAINMEDRPTLEYVCQRLAALMDKIVSPLASSNSIVTTTADDSNTPIGSSSMIATESADEIYAAVSGPSTVADIKSLPAVRVIDNSEIDILRTAYDALQKLGSGYYGVVYLVKCNKTGDLLVCKELCAELSTMEEMENEAKLLSLLGPTGAVPELLGVIMNVRQTGNYGLIQRYIPDMVTLDNLLDDPYYTDKVRLVNVALNLATALGNIHSLGVIHNDLKQDNILVRRSTSCVRIIYFGLATFNDGVTCDVERGEESRFPHVAPEVFHTKSSFESDIFSLGYVLEQINRKVGLSALDRLAQLCHGDNMDDRPTIGYVTQRLGALRERI